MLFYNECWGPYKSMYLNILFQIKIYLLNKLYKILFEKNKEKTVYPQVHSNFIKHFLNLKRSTSNNIIKLLET